ncbi:MAG TPA: ABC transporter substrate-binding protein [Thermoplasmata archaeon]|jgi:iron complex transport system substrate-binding protein|nr:ABC transporter substrate-binding protein [Thermoplasmata archaeon]
MSLNAPPPPAPPARRTVSAAVFVVAILVVAGVAVVATAGLYALRPASPSAGPNSIEVTDDLGRKVAVPYDPARVAVLSPSIMDIVYRLGLRSHVVGVDCYAAALGGLADDYSADQIALWNLSSSMCVQVGPTFDPTSLVNVTPQLVLASTIVSVAAVEEITATLGIPVVMLQPPTLSGILVDVTLVGEIFGVGAVAATLDGVLTSALYNATELDNSLTTFPTVLVTYSVDSNGYWTFGPSTFGESLIEIAGGASISAGATVAYPELSPSQVLVDDPAWIVYGTGYGLNESAYAAGPLWSSFGAVQAGNVTGIDSNWLTEPDPTMILEGIPALANVLNPGQL